MEELTTLLRDHEFLTGLDETDATQLASCVRSAHFAEGEFLMREGERSSYFYLIRTGRVALESNVPGKGVLQMESIGPGDVVGLSWPLPPYRVHIDARAVVPTETLAFDATRLREVMEGDHDLGYALMTRLYEKALRRLERVRLQRLDVYTAS